MERSVLFPNLQHLPPPLVVKDWPLFSLVLVPKLWPWLPSLLLFSPLLSWNLSSPPPNLQRMCILLFGFNPTPAFLLRSCHENLLTFLLWSSLWLNFPQNASSIEACFDLSQLDPLPPPSSDMRWGAFSNGLPRVLCSRADAECFSWKKWKASTAKKALLNCISQLLDPQRLFSFP